MQQRIHRKKTPFGTVLVYIVLILGCFITLAPFAWMFLTSFKTQVEAVDSAFHPPAPLGSQLVPDAFG